MPKHKRFVSAWFNTDYYDGAMKLLKQHAPLFDDISIGWIDYNNRDRRKEQAILDVCGSAGVKALVLVGGSDHPNAQAIDMIKHAPGDLVDYYVRESDRPGIAGVDVDYEGLPGDIRNAYTDFMCRLTEKLHDAGKTVSICVGPVDERVALYHARNNHTPFVDAEKVGAVVDQYRIMCYDMYLPPSPFVGPTATLPWVRDVLSHALKSVPRDRLIAGLTILSLDWNMSDPKKSDGLYDHDRIMELAKKSVCGLGYVMYYDVYYLRYVDADGSTHIAWINNAETFSYLLDLVNTLDIGGISVWELLGGDPGVWRVILEKLGK